MTTEEFVKRWSVWFTLHRDGQKLKEAFEKELGEVIQNSPVSMRSVPYQLCPRCNGEGKVFNLFQTTSGPERACDVCNGAKVIPQHLIET